MFEASASTTGQLKSADQEKAVVLIEYAVLPPVQEKFVEIFKKLQDATEKEEGM